jgi:hypothetical protein
MTTDDFARLLDERLAPLASELRSLGGRISGLSAEMTEMREQVATKRDLKALERRLTEFFNYLDKDVMENRKRMKRVERHLGLTPLQ